MEKKELNFSQELATISLFHLYNLSRSGIGHTINWIRSLDVESFEDFLKYLTTHNIRDERAFDDYCANIDRITEEAEKIGF